MIDRDRTLVTAAPSELRPDAGGAVDVFHALDPQFLWADTVMLAPECAHADDGEVLIGEVVWQDGHT